MFKRLDHVEIVTPNIDKSIDFYQNVLGFALKDRHKVQVPGLEEIAYLTLGDSMIELMFSPDGARPAEQPFQVGYRMMAIEVDDMDKTIGYLGSKGVTLSWGPMNLGESIRAEVRDPHGLPIELRQW